MVKRFVPIPQRIVHPDHLIADKTRLAIFNRELGRVPLWDLRARIILRLHVPQLDRIGLVIASEPQRGEEGLLTIPDHVGTIEHRPAVEVAGLTDQISPQVLFAVIAKLHVRRSHVDFALANSRSQGNRFGLNGLTDSCRRWVFRPHPDDLRVLQKLLHAELQTGARNHHPLLRILLRLPQLGTRYRYDPIVLSLPLDQRHLDIPDVIGVINRVALHTRHSLLHMRQDYPDLVAQQQQEARVQQHHASLSLEQKMQAHQKHQTRRTALGNLPENPHSRIVNKTARVPQQARHQTHHNRAAPGQNAFGDPMPRHPPAPNAHADTAP